MKIKTAPLVAALALLALSTLNPQLSTARAQGTAFTYQGRLNSSGAPANGSYDIAFTLYTTNVTGSALIGPVTNSAVAVTNGLFTTLVNFGTGVFTGASNWLAIAVSTNGANSFSTLAPRQQVTPTPYALYAGSANASNLVGTIPAMQLPATVVTNGASGVNLSGSFTFTGGSSTNLSAWQLNGNAGTTNGNYLGTADNQPLEIRVGGVRAGLISPSNGSPNIVFGPAQNIISNTTAGASILGGSGNMVEAGSSYSVIGGGSGNTIQIVDDHSVIGGGINNSIQLGANLSVLGGGQGNIIGSSAFASFLGSGIGNQIMSGASYSVIGGGTANGIQANAYESAIGGGNGNTIQSGSVGSFIGCGIDNNIQLNDIYSVLVGGSQNVIWTGATYSFLGGGQFNNVQAGGINSVLGGGSYNTILAGNSFLGGGQQNTISNNATYAVLAGGVQNGVGGSYASVVGGSNNLANGANSFAAGTSARATNSGAFVWSDVEGTPFTSTNANSFNVRANGGVRLVTGGAGLTVDGSPVQTGSNGGGLTNLNASQLTSGTVPLAQLPNTVVTNGESGVGLNNLIANANLFVTGALWLTEPPNILSGGSIMLTVDTNANSYFGFGAGYASPGTGGSYNTGMGGNALQSNTAGNNNVAVGYGALQNTTTDSELVAIGFGALQNDNAASGFGLTGSGFGENTAVGYRTLLNNTVGYGNTALGYQALLAETNGFHNTALGNYALGNNPNGFNNTAVGAGSLSGLGGGGDNIAVGYQAGKNLQAGYHDIYIGNTGNSADNGIIDIGEPGVQTDAYLAGILHLANNSLAVGGNQLVVSGGNVGIGTNSPAYSLDVNGTIHSTGANINGKLALNGSLAMTGNVMVDGGIQLTNSAGTTAYTLTTDTLNVGEGMHAGYISVDDSITVNYNVNCLTLDAVNIVQLSDRNAKENFQPVDSQSVLAKVAALPVTQWNYKDTRSAQHIGPMAQDFQAAFGLNGGDDKHITTVDEGGVALAAIQGLNEKVEEQRAELKQKEAEVTELRQRLSALEKVIFNQKSN